MKADAIVKALTPAQRDFLQQKKIEAELVPAEWFALLENCANFDRDGDRIRNTALTWLIAGCVSLVVGIVLLLTPLAIPAIALVLVGGWLVFNYTPTFMQLRKLDIKADLKQFCLPMLSILREDMIPTDKIRMTLDLRGNDHSEKQVRAPQQLEPAAHYLKATTTGFRDQWFSGEAELRDGSRVRWRVIDDVQRLERTRRTARGKMKTKRKYKRTTEMYVQIKFPESKYQVQDPPFKETHAEAMNIAKQGQTVKVFRQIKQNSSAHNFPPDFFLHAVGHAFKLAQPKGKG